MMIDGNTQLIAHIGFPTHSFKSPLIYNPYFEHAGINACVVPMSCEPQHFNGLLNGLKPLGNLLGALITMPHKTAVMSLLDDVSTTAQIAGSCNAIKFDASGRLIGDMFDGEGFVRGLAAKGFSPAGKRALVVGSGGVGCAIAASLAQSGVMALALYDTNHVNAQALAQRLKKHYPLLTVTTHHNDPTDCDLVVNATPLGMNVGDPLPIDVSQLSPNTFVGEVVMRTQRTAFVQAAQAAGCQVQVGVDMLFEQIPAYLEFFELPSTTAHKLRALAQLDAS